MRAHSFVACMATCTVQETTRTLQCTPENVSLSIDHIPSSVIQSLFSTTTWHAGTDDTATPRSPTPELMEDDAELMEDDAEVPEDDTDDGLGDAETDASGSSDGKEFDSSSSDEESSSEEESDDSE